MNIIHRILCALWLHRWEYEHKGRDWRRCQRCGLFQKWDIYTGMWL